MDHHVACLALDFLPARAYSYSALPSFFERAVHRRHLRSAPVNCRATAPVAGAITRHRPFLDHFASASPVVGLHAQPQRGLVGLVGIQLQLAELGGRAEAQRQHAGGQRIERAGVAGLFGAQQPFGLLQGSLLERPSGLSSSSTPCTGRRCTLVRGAFIDSVFLCTGGDRLGDQGVHVGRALGGAVEHGSAAWAPCGCAGA